MVDVLTDDDHARGCQGREYACTCGYDDRIAAEIERLRAENERLRAALEAVCRAAIALNAADRMGLTSAI